MTLGVPIEGQREFAPGFSLLDGSLGEALFLGDQLLGGLLWGGLLWGGLQWNRW